MRLLLTLLFILTGTALLHAGDPDDFVADLRAGNMKLVGGKVFPDESASAKAIALSYKGLHASYANAPFGNTYAELGYRHEYGFFAEAYSYTDSRTNGVRLGYRYNDPQTQWAPFVRVSVQRAGAHYAIDDEPRNNFGAAIGLSYFFTHEQIVTVTLFREFMRNPVSSTEAAYAFDGSHVFGHVKVALVVGDPLRSQSTRRYVNWSARIGTYLGDHFGVFAYSETSKYRDFRFEESIETGAGIRATF